MSDDPSKIGLQHPAFAVSKSVLLRWLNDFFELNYNKVEECASGAVYCQILDCIYPGKVPMSRVNWGAKSDYEFVNNFKLVQNVMVKCNVTKPVPIDRLVKAKYQDNLEFLQWFKHFFECRYGGQPYDAKARRGKKGAQKKLGASSARPAARPTSARTVSSKTSGKSTSSTSSASSAAAAAENKALQEQIATLQNTVEGLEKERDFYFSKLREVEVLCQEEGDAAGDTVTKAQVLEILYKTDEAEEEAGETEAAGGDEETF